MRVPLPESFDTLHAKTRIGLDLYLTQNNGREIEENSAIEMML